MTTKGRSIATLAYLSSAVALLHFYSSARCRSPPVRYADPGLSSSKSDGIIVSYPSGAARSNTILTLTHVQRKIAGENPERKNVALRNGACVRANQRERERSTRRKNAEKDKLFVCLTRFARQLIITRALSFSLSPGWSVFPGPFISLFA